MLAQDSMTIRVRGYRRHLDAVCLLNTSKNLLFLLYWKTSGGEFIRILLEEANFCEDTVSLVRSPFNITILKSYASSPSMKTVYPDNTPLARYMKLDPIAKAGNFPSEADVLVNKANRLDPDSRHK